MKLLVITGCILMICSPFIFVLLVWRYSKQRKLLRVLTGLILAVLFSCLLFSLLYSMAWREVLTIFF